VIALVVAETEQAAKDAALAVVVEYEDLPAVLTIEVCFCSVFSEQPCDTV
jgi:xanthine dehydrogenase molybdopterin-binding subunit B